MLYANVATYTAVSFEATGHIVVKRFIADLQNASGDSACLGRTDSGTAIS